MNKFWYIIGTILSVILGAFAPPVRTFLAAHTDVAMVLGTAWTILGNLITPPVVITVKPVTAVVTAPKS